MKRSRALIIAGLSIFALANGANSASAATISPTSADFGRLLIGRTSAPKTLTVTVGSGDRCRSPGPPGVCYPIIPSPADGGFVGGNNTLGFLDIRSLGTCHQVAYLTATTPSCTIVVALKPDRPGPLKGGVLANDYDLLVFSDLTGIGLLSRKSIYCRSPKKGGIYKKNLTRWCVNRQKK